MLFLEMSGSAQVAQALFAQLHSIAKKEKKSSTRFRLFLSLLGGGGTIKEDLSKPERLKDAISYHFIARLLRELQHGKDNVLLPPVGTDDMVPFSVAEQALRHVLAAARIETRNIGQCSFQVKQKCDQNSDSGLCSTEDPAIKSINLRRCAPTS